MTTDERFAAVQARARESKMVMGLYLMLEHRLPDEGEVRAIPFRRVDDLDASLDEQLTTIENELEYWEGPKA